MNTEIKVSLTIELEGSTLVRKSEPIAIYGLITKQGKYPKKKFNPEEGTQIIKRVKQYHYPYYTKPASQHLNISLDTYNYMISNNCPSDAKIKSWKGMSTKQRLEHHFQKICEQCKGKSYTYEILAD